MSGHKDSFQDRLKSASAAKKTMLATFNSRPAADDPAVVRQAADRVAASAARDERASGRKQAKEAEALATKAAAAEAKALLKVEEDGRAAQAALKQKAVPTELEKKAARDARYAARKARK
jgi:hypothetical protein